PERHAAGAAGARGAPRHSAASRNQDGWYAQILPPVSRTPRLSFQRHEPHKRNEGQSPPDQALAEATVPARCTAPTRTYHALAGAQAPARGLARKLLQQSRRPPTGRARARDPRRSSGAHPPARRRPPPAATRNGAAPRA